MLLLSLTSCLVFLWLSSLELELHTDGDKLLDMVFREVSEPMCCEYQEIIKQAGEMA